MFLSESGVSEGIEVFVKRLEVVLLEEVVLRLGYHVLDLQLLLHDCHEVVEGHALELHVSEVLVLFDCCLAVVAVLKLHSPLSESHLEDHDALLLEKVHHPGVELALLLRDVDFSLECLHCLGA